VGFFGSFFSFFRKKSSDSSIEEQLEERRLRPRVNPKEETRVLVIDDSPTILTAMKRFLESAHCVFLGALDAKMGMEVALTQKPDLIFLDIVMPGINGFAALRALRKNARTRDIPIIMMSGNEQAKAQFFGAHIGADDFMKKPFSRFEVFARIARLLDTNRVPRRIPSDTAASKQASPEPAQALPEPQPPQAAPQPETKTEEASVPVPQAKTQKSGKTARARKTDKTSSAQPSKQPSPVPAATSQETAAPAAPTKSIEPQAPSGYSTVRVATTTPQTEAATAHPVSAQVVSITQATLPNAIVSPELLSRISRLAQLAPSDHEALKALVVLSTQLISQFAAASKSAPAVAQNRIAAP
jgi:twitching motility two-component system response regulator PilH